MCLTQIKQAQIKFPLSGFWTVQPPRRAMQRICTARQDNVASQPKFWLAKDEEAY
jgi:hypothetical protein